MAAEAARKQDSHLEEILFLSLQLKYLSWQDNIVDGKPLIIRLSILESTTPMPDEIFLLYRQASAFHYIAQQDFSTAQRLLQGSLSVGTQTSDKHGYNASKHWIAVCLYRQGYINEAKDTFREAIYEGIPWQVERAKYVHSTRLIEIYLDQDDLNAATEELERIDPIIYKLQDRRYVSLTRHLTARLHTLRGDIPAARAALAEAIDLFERLGMRRELAEARADLARLDAPDAPVGGASGAADLSGGDDHSSGPAPA
jgi:tetratricopeptide (TPR) repeat protein